MYDEFNNYTPDYSAPVFETPPAFDPFELTFDAPELPAFDQPHYDPIADMYPVVDAFIFDQTAINAGVGYAMNELARMNQLSADSLQDMQSRLEWLFGICGSYGLAVQMRHGFPCLTPASLDLLVSFERDDYYSAQRDYAAATGYRF